MLVALKIARSKAVFVHHQVLAFELFYSYILFHSLVPSGWAIPRGGKRLGF